jgi:hypothetical protein
VRAALDTNAAGQQQMNEVAAATALVLGGMDDNLEGWIGLDA